MTPQEPSGNPSEERCSVPPPGRSCSRVVGHEGPCAARPVIPLPPDEARAEAADEDVRLVIVPLTLTEANVFVERHHRHSVPTVGHKFSVGAAVGDRIVGVGITGRPISRALDNGWTLEVLRVCTDGHPNACSMLYATCWRACRAMGYRRVVTYTRADEDGTSLRAAGWRVVGEVKARSWHTPSRPRVDRDERQDRFRWEATA